MAKIISQIVMINFDILSWLISIVIISSSLLSLFLAKNSFSARKFMLYGCLISLAFALYAIFYQMIFVSHNLRSTILFFVILLILCAYLLALIFTPLYKSSLNSYATIGLITLSSIILFYTDDILVFFLTVFFTLGVIFVSIEQNRPAKKMMAMYAFIALVIVLITKLFFPDHLKSAMFYFALLPFLGLFPFQSWYLSFFAKAPFGVIAALISFQAIVILSSSSFLKTADFFTPQLVLSILILISSMMAIIQNHGRKMLSYLLSSQLGFLLFAAMANATIADFGSVFMTLTFLGSSVALVMMVSAIEIRKNDISLFRPSGCYDSYPKLAIYFLIFGLISSGLPLSIGYVAEDLIFERSFAVDPVADFFCLVAIAVNTIAIVKMFLFLCQGTAKKEHGIDLKKCEIIAAAFVLITVFFTTILSI